MEISYNPLFKLLIDKGMKKTDLAKEADFIKTANCINGNINQNM